MTVDEMRLLERVTVEDRLTPELGKAEVWYVAGASIGAKRVLFIGESVARLSNGVALDLQDCETKEFLVGTRDWTKVGESK